MKLTGLPLIGEYQLTQPWSNINSGSAIWSFANYVGSNPCKKGREYFIKCFLSPVCAEPGKGIPKEEIELQQKNCNEFFYKKSRLYAAVNKSTNGNIVGVEDFFFFKTKFYMVTERIHHSNITPKQVAALPVEKKLLILKVLAHSMKSLHENRVVHADIKPSNVLFKTVGAAGNSIPKLIDFGDSFLQNEPAKYLVGDTYLSPESYCFIEGEKVKVGVQADIFSLGLLFTEFYTGKLPWFADGYDFACEAVMDGRAVVPAGVDIMELKLLITEMLELYPEKRPTAGQVFDAIQRITGTNPADELWTCRFCGQKNKTDTKYCKKCGTQRGKKDPFEPAEF